MTWNSTESICTAYANDESNVWKFRDSSLQTDIDLSYLRPLKREKVRERFETFCHRGSLNAASYENALVLPGKNRKGGVIDQSGDLVYDSITSWFGECYDLEEGQEIQRDARRVVYLGEYATSCYGHAFTDLLIRFWYCLSAPEGVDAYVIISEYPGQKQDSDALNELIRLAGISEKTIFVSHPTVFREVIVPEPSFTGNWYTDEYLKTIDTIRQNALSEPCNASDILPEKIFLSRSHFDRAKQGEGGLELLDDYFRNNGFAIIHPEEQTLVYMIRLMHNAALCASESGSITFNTLFGSSDLNVVVIERIPVFAEGNIITNLSRAKCITYVDGCYAVYPMNVGGPCILGFTEEFRRFTDDNRYQYPSPMYLESEYRKECFDLYCHRYNEQNTYERWLRGNKKDWLPVIYEAFSASSELFAWLNKEEIINKYYQDTLQSETVMLQVKRLFDILLGLLGIVCLAPLWILTGIVIKTCVHGSILFRQTRIGYHETKFQILKFRTMHEGKESASLHNQIPVCGKILRRLRLDELPQLINIVKGEMSFVGPRPYIEQESIGLPIERYKMRPGLTGLAQVNGNTELFWDERTAYDLYYIENYTLWMDICILFRTIKVILLGEKACVSHFKSDVDR